MYYLIKLPNGVMNQNSTIKSSLTEYLNSVKFPDAKTLALIKSIRSSTSKEEKTKLKKKLPAVMLNTSSKTFKGDYIPNGIIFLDIDNLQEKTSEINIKYNQDYSTDSLIEKFKNYDFVIGIYKSCSGKGIHIIASYNELNEEYFSNKKKSLKPLTSYLNEFYFYNILDPACSNVNRCTYVSYDEDIYVKENKKIIPFSEDISNFLETKSSLTKKEIKSYENIGEKLDKNKVIINEDFLSDFKTLPFSDFLVKYKNLDVPNRSEIIYDETIDVNDPYIKVPEYFFEIYFPYERIFDFNKNKNIIVIKKIKIGKRNNTMFVRSLTRKRILTNITIEQIIYCNCKDFYDHFEKADFEKSEIIDISVNAFISTYHSTLKRTNKELIYNPFYKENNDVENIKDGNIRKIVKIKLYNFNKKRNYNKILSKYYDFSLTIEQNRKKILDNNISISVRKIKSWLCENRLCINDLFNKFFNNINIVADLIETTKHCIFRQRALFNNNQQTENSSNNNSIFLMEKVYGTPEDFNPIIDFR